MDVKEAVRIAKEYLGDLFEAEPITNVGLEEVVFEDASNSWKVTIGFSRPWDQKGLLVTALAERGPERSYKVLRIDNDNGRVESLTDRLLKAPE